MIQDGALVFERDLNQIYCAPSVFRRPGGYGGVSIPDPISNSAVNRSSANGTSS